MNCKFYIKSVNSDKEATTIELTESEIIGYLLSNGFNIDSKGFKLKNQIKYSLASDTIDKLKSESKEHKLKVSEIVGNDEIFEDNEYITAQWLVDSDEFRSVGFMRIPQKNDANYLENMTRILMSEDMNEDEAKRKAQWNIDHWDIISKDALSLHRALPRLLVNLNNNTEFNKVLKDFNLYDRLKGTVTLPDGSTKSKITIFQESLLSAENFTINSLIGAIDKEKSANALNIFLDLELPNIGKTLGVHFDKIYIDQNGEIYIINYKFSASPVSEWSQTKKEKYNYKMALVKRVLEAKGYNVNGIKIYDIPMYMEYEGNDIKSIRRDPNKESINYVISNNRASLLKYENYVKQFIDAPVKVNRNLEEEDIDEIDNIIQTIFPKVGMHAEGIKITAQQWIKSNIGISIIANSDLTSDIKYFVDLQDGQPSREITEKTTPTENQQILNLVQSHTELLENGEFTIMNHLIKAIRSNYKKKTSIFENGSGFRFNGAYLQNTLQPYFEYVEENNEQVPIWEMIETPTLHAVGMILFRNRYTKQIDLVIASPYDVNHQISLDYGKNLLGMHQTDMNVGKLAKATYGNMEIMRGMIVLNHIANNIVGEFKLGNIKVISPTAGGLYRTFEQMMPHFGKIIQFTNTKLQHKVDNNLYKVKTLDPVQSILTHAGILFGSSTVSDTEKQRIADFGFKELNATVDLNSRIQILQELLENIEERLGYPTIDQIIRYTTGRNLEQRILSTIYLEANSAILHYYGNSEISMDKISTVERYVLPQYANPDPNVRMIANLYTRALDETASVFQTEYKFAKESVKDFYDAIGYGSTSKLLVGRSAPLFDNLYRQNEKGERELIFKNPYDDTSLSQAERTFLKKALFHLAKMKKRMGLYQDFNFKNENDPKLIEWINGQHRIDYFYVPLKKKSSKTENATPIKTLGTKIDRAKRLINEARSDFKQFIQNRIEESQDKFEYSKENVPVEKFTVVNFYKRLEDPKLRATQIHRFGVDYFETDVEQLLADYTASQIISEQMKKVQFRAKAILTQIHLLGNVEGHEKEIQATIKEIEDFLKLNVFGQSIMEQNSQQFMLMLKPLKSLVSKIYIAGNIRSAFRDTFEGVWQNIARSVIKYQTDLKPSSVSEGYKIVISNAIQSMKGMGVLSELCLRYRLSNTDEAKIAERATVRGGLFDPDSWMYSTLRGPDFLNRMVLFTARCVQDGVWEAFDLDDKGNLVYNWRKDKRFSELAANNTQSPKYAEQKGLYMSYIRLYNKEHSNANLSYEDDLPEPYSQNEISNFKRFSDSIYGSYDKSQRSKMENILIGQTYCMFSTWLNGMVVNYFKRPGEYAENYVTEQAKDSAGNLLFFDSDGRIYSQENGKFIDEFGEEKELDKAYPAYAQVPIQVQGIIYTVRDVLKIFSKKGWGEVQDKVLSNPQELANLKKLLSDMIMAFLMSVIFGWALKGGYEAYKKDQEHKDVIENAFVEVLYNSAANSYDGFLGPVAIFKYALNDTEPLAVNASVQLAKDLGRTIFGSSSWEALLYKDIPVFRAFKQTYTKMSKIEQKKQANSNT